MQNDLDDDVIRRCDESAWTDEDADFPNVGQLFSSSDFGEKCFQSKYSTLDTPSNFVAVTFNPDLYDLERPTSVM